VRSGAAGANVAPRQRCESDVSRRDAGHAWKHPRQLGCRALQQASHQLQWQVSRRAHGESVISTRISPDSSILRAARQCTSENFLQMRVRRVPTADPYNGRRSTAASLDKHEVNIFSDHNDTRITSGLKDD
jgi:hypothetical protein